MSSKKKLRRRQRTAQKEQARQGKANPAWLFILGIVLVIGLTLGGVAIFGDRSGPGDPPWPGAVWSPAHGHWH